MRESDTPIIKRHGSENKQGKTCMIIEFISPCKAWGNQFYLYKISLEATCINHDLKVFLKL